MERPSVDGCGESSDGKGPEPAIFGLPYKLRLLKDDL